MHQSSKLIRNSRTTKVAHRNKRIRRNHGRKQREAPRNYTPYIRAHDRMLARSTNWALPRIQSPKHATPLSMASTRAIPFRRDQIQQALRSPQHSRSAQGPPGIFPVDAHGSREPKESPTEKDPRLVHACGDHRSRPSLLVLSCCDDRWNPPLNLGNESAQNLESADSGRLLNAQTFAGNRIWGLRSTPEDPAVSANGDSCAGRWSHIDRYGIGICRGRHGLHQAKRQAIDSR